VMCERSGVGSIDGEFATVDLRASNTKVRYDIRFRIQYISVSW
jgi:hypothetical protein